MKDEQLRKQITDWIILINRALKLQKQEIEKLEFIIKDMQRHNHILYKRVLWLEDSRNAQ